MSPAGTASRSSSRGNRPSPPSRDGHSPSSRLGTKTIGNSRPFAWYSVISRTPSTSSDSSTLVGSSPPARLVGIEVRDEPGQRPARVGRLPVGREAQEARDVGDGPLRLERVGGDQVEHAGRSARGSRSRIVCGPSRKVSGLSSSSAPQELAQLGARAGGRIDLVVRRAVLAPLADDVDLDLPGRRRSPRRSRAGAPDRTSPSGVTRRISSASSRHGPAVIIRTSATSSCGSAIARSACSRSRISGVSNRLRPPTTVYGMSSSRSRATIASRCLCLRYRTATSVQRAGRSPPRPST